MKYIITKKKILDPRGLGPHLGLSLITANQTTKSFDKAWSNLIKFHIS